MAEVVEFRVERRINQLLQLEKNGLLSNDEIKTINKRRKAFEYRLQRNRKFAEDYLKYIAYEEALLKLVKLRRRKYRFGAKLMKQMDNVMVADIRALYQKVVFKFDTIPLWMSYIEFCKKMRQMGKVAALYMKALQLHDKEDSLWISAAKWNFEDNNSPETARSLLQRAIRINSSSRQLWREYFRLELMYCEKIRKRREVLEKTAATDDVVKDAVTSDIQEIVDCVKDDVWDGKISMIVYRNAVLSFGDFDFAVEFLEICDQFDHTLTKAHKELIYDDIKLRFSDLEEMYHLIARRSINDLKCEMKLDSDLTKLEKRQKLIDCEQHANSLYEEIIEEINTEKMWTYYIRFNLELLGKCKNETKIRIYLRKVLDICEKAYDCERLSSDMFREWLILLNSCADTVEHKRKIDRLLLTGFDRYNDSADTLRFCLGLQIEITTSKSEMKTFFERCLSKTLSNNVLPVDKIIEIWKLYVDWSMKALLPVEMMSVAERAAKLTADSKSREIVAYFKHNLLTTSQLSYGIERSRVYYHKYKYCPPITKQFFDTMLTLELNNSSQNSQLIRSVFQDLTQNFGSDDASIWIDYLEFEMNNNPTAIGLIYNKAIKSLTAVECDRFIAEHSLLQTSHHSNSD